MKSKTPIFRSADLLNEAEKIQRCDARIGSQNTNVRSGIETPNTTIQDLLNRRRFEAKPMRLRSELRATPYPAVRFANEQKAASRPPTLNSSAVGCSSVTVRSGVGHFMDAAAAQLMGCNRSPAESVAVALSRSPAEA
jgi:hypothetical protein